MHSSPARIYVRVVWCALVLFPAFFIGCGGSGSGSGSSISPPLSAAPGFTLSLSPNQIDLSQSATQKVQVQVAPENGFSGSVTVTLTGLPSGVTSSPSTLSVSANSPGTLVFTAAANATPGNIKVSIAGSSGSVQVSAALALDVIQMAAPIAVPFTTTGGNIVKAFYDESRQLLFATNLALNEVDVLIGSSLSVQARIPIAQPFGIDQMPDGNTLVVGTFTQGFYTIDENTLAVKHYLAPNFSQQFSTVVLLIPVAMANGNVLFMGKDFGVASGDIFIYGGQAIVEWNSSSGQFSMPFYVPYLSLEIDNLKRSADHNWAAYAADKLYIYSSATDGFISSAGPVSSAPFGVRDIAANPNGTQFAIVSAQSVSFYDGAFNALGTASLAPTSDLFFEHYNTQYSSDGSLLYWELSSAGSVVDVLNTSTFTEVGHIISAFGTQTQFESDLLWVDNAQQAFLSAVEGVGLLDCSSPHTDALEFVGAVGPNPSVIPLNQSVSVTLNDGIPTGTSVTFGGQLAPFVSDETNNIVVQVPPSNVAGPVNLVFSQLDGETFTEPQDFVYGVDVAAPTSTLVPPIGNPVMGLFGFGILNGPFATPTITVGGQNVANAAVNPNANYILQELFFQLPNGTPGPADITVTSVNGTGMLKGAVTYIPFAKIIPATGSFVQILYDTHRSLLYALQSNEIQVLNPTTLQWQRPLIPGGSGGFGYVSMALTPDGTQMVALDATASTLTVFDPDNPTESVTTSVKPNSGTLVNVVTSATGKAFIANGGAPIAFDLATNTYATTNIFTGVPSRFVATPDGNHVAGVNQNANSGTLTTWSAAVGASTQSLSGIYWTDVAVSNDGSLFAALEGEVGYAGNYAAFFDGELHYTNVTVYPDLAPPDQSFCTGAIFSASGLTLLNPLADSIDFFSTETATLQGRLLMPELLPVGDLTAGTIALDPNQETIYAISASGLTVVTLPSSVDLVKPFSWPYVAKPPRFASPGTRGQLRRVDMAAR